MSSLALTDRLENNSWVSATKWKLLNIFYIRDRNTDFKRQVDTIRQTKKLSPTAFFTGKFGLTILGQFPQNMTSITKTAIGLITPLKTLSACQVQYIGGNTCSNSWRPQGLKPEHLRDKRKPFSRHQSGTVPQRGLHGTETTAKNLGLVEKPPQFNVLFAKNHLSHTFHQEQDFVPEVANSQDVIQDKRPRKKNALFAKLNSWLTNIGILNTALVSAQIESAPPTKVYNLTLESENVYYANGILVANCADALALTFAVGDYISNSSYTANFIPEKAQGMFI